jgi:hypothetical protein
VVKPAAALAGAAAALAAVHAAFTAATVVSHTLRHPLQDEFRIAHRYLTTPFPESILATENGHHPVIPGLLRWIQLEWMGGAQWLQVAAAWLAAAAIAIVVARESWKGLRTDPALRVAAISLAVTILFWNATARMFIHAHEAAHVFFAAGFAALALAAALRALEERRPAPWWTLALASCAAALLSFGAGAAAFVAVVAVALLARRWRAAGLLAVATAALFVLYSLALPGREEVGRMSSVTSPAATLYFWLLRMGAVFGEMTRHKESVSFAASLLALATAASIARLWLAGHAFSRLETLAVALFVFGAATNAAIALTRTQYFFEYRDQLFGERFLFWSCVTWAGMGLFACARLAGKATPLRLVACAAIVVLSAGMIPAAKRVHSWAGTKYREVELAAMVVRLDARAPSRIRNVVDHAEEEAYALGREMRKHAAGDFRTEPEVRLGSRLAVEGESGVRIRAGAKRVEGITTPAALYEIALDGTGLARGERLWIVDRSGIVIGAAGPTTGKIEGYVARIDEPARLVRLDAAGRYQALANLAF